MEYRILGKTGLRVSRMGFGGIPIQKINEEGTRKVILALREAGVNYIDTARMYTVSEQYLGYALQGIRQDFVLATKSTARTAEAMEKDIQISLDNLRTDYIDLYQIHNPTMPQFEQVIASGGALEALLAAKEAGKIGHLGVTAHSYEVFEKALTLPWVETIMFPYNIVETQGEDLIRACAEKNIGFIDMKPLAGGALDNATLALRFVTSNPNVTLTIPGMAAISEVDENLSAVNDNSPLSVFEIEQIAEIRKILGTQFCRRCNYCAPCTAGIGISSVFLFEGYYTRYHLEDWARERYATLPKTASDCIDCGVCETRCPYQLPIRQMMKDAARIFGK